MNLLQRIVGRLFGFHDTIRDLERKVEELSWDDAFGMWTRSAFLQLCRVMPRQKRVVVFIDLDDIHGRNLEWGYVEVDRRIRQAFAIPLRRSDIVARWYSGDEIVILFDADREAARRKVEQLAQSARSQGLSFQYAIGDWEVGVEPIEDVVEELTTEVSAKKAAAKAAPGDK